MDLRVEFVLFVIHSNRRFIPVGHDILLGVECQHIVHRRQVGLDVANHDLHFSADTVIHLPNATGARVFHMGRRCEVVETDVRRGLTPECECDFLLHTDRGLCQCQADMARNTNEYYAEILGKSDGGQGLTRSRGGDIKDQLGCGRLLFENGE